MAGSFRFNPPPNWPSPPDGWTPPPGWQPDPAWGPAPDGWALWVEAEPVDGILGGLVGAGLDEASVPDGSASPPAADDAPLRVDIEQAIARMGRTLGIRRELRGLADRLDPGESVVELARVERAGHGCLLVVSDRRLLFLREGMVRNTVEEVPIRALTSVGSHRRLGNGALLVTVAGNAERWPMTSGSHSERVSEAIRQVMRQHAVTVSSAPATPVMPTQPESADLVDQLRKLGELRDAGILTDEEFAAKKADILGRI